MGVAVATMGLNCFNWWAQGGEGVKERKYHVSYKVKYCHLMKANGY